MGLWSNELLTQMAPSFLARARLRVISVFKIH